MNRKHNHAGGETPPEPPAESAAVPEETVTLAREDWKNLSDQAAKAAECRDQLLRLAADFDNFRKRTDNEKRQLGDFAESVLLSRFLPILDSIEQVLKLDEEEDAGNMAAGLKLIARELHRTFRDVGLKPLEILDKPFDPHTAEAVEVQEDPDSTEGTVLSILRTGYQYKDRIIRPALVRVSRKPSGGEPPNAKDGSPCPGQD